MSRRRPPGVAATDSGAVAARDVHLEGKHVAGRDLYVFEGPAFPRLAYGADIAGLVGHYVAVFAGRERELDRLMRLAADPDPGYLLVEAPPAYGKSALVAQLVHQRDQGRWAEGLAAPDLVYYFVRTEGSRNTVEAFCSALNAQLLDLLDLPGGVPTDREAQRAQLLRLWEQAVARAAPERPRTQRNE